MKKIINISLLIAFLIAFVGCKDDDDSTGQTFESVKVENLDFGVFGGTGTVIASEDVVRAKSSNEDWCKVVSISGTTVSIQTILNPDISSRNATVTLYSANEEEIVVKVNQLGMVFDLESLDDLSINKLYVRGGIRKFLLTTNMTSVDIEFEDSWLQHEKRGDTIIIDYPQTTEYRDTKLNFFIKDSDGNIVAERSIELTQDAYTYNELSGSWTLSYRASTGLSRTANVTLVTNVTEKSYTMNGIPLTGTNTASIPVEYEDGNLVVRSYQSIGMNAGLGYYLHMFVYDYNSQLWATSYSVAYTGVIDKSVPLTSGMTYNFVDLNSQSGFNANSIAFLYSTTDNIALTWNDEEGDYYRGQSHTSNWIIRKQ